LTQKELISTLVLLNLAFAPGITLLNVQRRKAKRGGRLPLKLVDKHMSPITGNAIQKNSSTSLTCAGFLHWKTCETFQYLRTIVTTINKGTQAAIPHRDVRSPICLVWFSSPRGKSMTTNYRRAHDEGWRMGHGSARAIENLRGLRQSFLPRPNSRKHLLPRL
jgi:hypothetical protein